jgi:hypothetical protein
LNSAVDLLSTDDLGVQFKLEALLLENLLERFASVRDDGGGASMNDAM